MTDNEDLQETEPAVLLLTITEAAARLGFGRTFTYELVKAGDIETVTVGRSRRVPADVLVEYVDRLRREQNGVAA
jgi:excisionase family DNA binding protein